VVGNDRKDEVCIERRDSSEEQDGWDWLRMMPGEWRIGSGGRL
jgi:hypothetical protein